MKLSGYILMVLVVALCFAIVGNVVDDFNTYYPERTINTSWSSKYDYSESVNKSVGRIKEQFDIIGDEDEGWFSQITAGITAIPLAIVAVPTVLFETVGKGIRIVSELGDEIGIPPFVITILVISIIIIIIFGLVSFWHRSKA